MTSLNWTRFIDKDFPRVNPTKEDIPAMLKHLDKIGDVHARKGIITQDMVDEHRIRIDRECSQKYIQPLSNSLLEKTESLIKSTYQSAMFWLQDNHPEIYTPFVQRGLAPNPYTLELATSQI